MVKLAAIVLIALGGGCSDSTRDLLPYEDCTAADRCVEGQCVTITAPSGENAGICTHSCTDDNDCPNTPGGLAGACLASDLVGGMAGTQTCLERCTLTSDCDTIAGFTCQALASETVCLPTL